MMCINKTITIGGHCDRFEFVNSRFLNSDMDVSLINIFLFMINQCGPSLQIHATLNISAAPKLEKL